MPDVQLRWSSDGPVMPEVYDVPEGDKRCEQAGERCGGRYWYEQRGCRGANCRTTQRDEKRRKS